LTRGWRIEFRPVCALMVCNLWAASSRFEVISVHTSKRLVRLGVDRSATSALFWCCGFSSGAGVFTPPNARHGGRAAGLDSEPCAPSRFSVLRLFGGSQF